MSLPSLNKQIRTCTRCRLYKTATHGVPGEGPSNAKIFFVGVAPGRQEDRTGRPFVGRAGKFLDVLLKSVGINRKDVFISSIVKHFPPKNRVPRQDEIAACRPYLIEQIRLINPQIVVLLGRVAQKALAHHPVLLKRKVVKTFHPAAGMRFPAIKKSIMQDFSRLKRMQPKI